MASAPALFSFAGEGENQEGSNQVLWQVLKISGYAILALTGIGFFVYGDALIGRKLALNKINEVVGEGTTTHSSIENKENDEMIKKWKELQVKQVEANKEIKSTEENIAHIEALKIGTMGKKVEEKFSDERKNLAQYKEKIDELENNLIKVSEFFEKGEKDCLLRVKVALSYLNYFGCKEESAEKEKFKKEFLDNWKKYFNEDIGDNYEKAEKLVQDLGKDFAVKCEVYGQI